MMHILKPNQFSGDALTEHIELEEELSPFLDQSDELNQAYFDAVIRKAKGLFDTLFPNGEGFTLVYHVYGDHPGNTGMFRLIRDKSLRFQTALIRSEEEEETLWTYIVPIADRDQIRMSRLLEAICHQDFQPLRPRLRGWAMSYPAVQFIHQEAGHVLFVYDDRGAYIRGTSPEHLQAIKQKISSSFMPDRT